MSNLKTWLESVFLQTSGIEEDEIEGIEMNNRTPMGQLYMDLINTSITAQLVQKQSKDKDEVSFASTIQEALNQIILELVIEIPSLAGSVDFEKIKDKNK